MMDRCYEMFLNDSRLLLLKTDKPPRPREMNDSHVKWTQRILDRNLPSLLFHRYGPSSFGLFPTQNLTDSIFSCFLSSLMVLQPRD